MKILLINNLYPPYTRGGAEIVVQKQAQDFLRRGYEVHVLTTQPISFKNFTGWFSSKNENNIHVHRYTPNNIISYYNLHRLPKFLRSLWHLIDAIDVTGYFLLKGLMRRNNFQEIYTHNCKGTGMMLVRACAKADFHAHVLHDVQLITPSGLLFFGKEKSWEVCGIFASAYQWIMRKVFKNVKNIQAPSQWVVDKHRKFGFFENSSIRVLRPEQKKVTQKSGAGKFVFVGQIEEHKGIEFLLKVFSATKTHKWHLDVVGEGSLLKKLKKQYADNFAIVFHGKVGREKLRELYQNVDTLLVPSLCYENTPTVITEAHEYGLKVVASKIGGIPEMVFEGDRLLAVGSEEEWGRFFRY